MAQHAKKLVNMRQKFTVKDKNCLHWFPGHMDKGMKVIQQRLSQVDCVVEVHDARISLSGRNPQLAAMTAMKPHILVLNKMDLIPHYMQDKIKEALKRQNVNNVIFTNCKSDMDRGVRKIFRLMVELITQSERYNRSEIQSYQGMIIGVPNVGKSSLLNRLRNSQLKQKSASAVGAQAGITRSVLTKIKISENPDVFILDTPGILTPKVSDVITGLKLALCSCFLDHLVGEEILADFLLYMLNKSGNFSYIEKMGLKEPTDNITEVLACRAVQSGNFMKFKTTTNEIKTFPNMLESAKYMVRCFRNADFGKIMLDEDILNPPEDEEN